MVSRFLAFLAAASLAAMPVASAAQTETTPTAGLPTTEEQRGADLLLILGAIAAAALVTLLATQIGGNDDPASP
jgi:hypothetical protein